MLTTHDMFRLAKIIVVGSLAVMATIIVIGNCTDYYTNYHFVEHVLKMDTVFPFSNLRYRQINTPVVYNISYILIILSESAMALFCLLGCVQMAKQFKSSGSAFHAAKKWAVAGICIGILVWFLGFEVTGGEWFCMWQSPTWNGLAAAERIVSFLMLALILLYFKEED